MNRSSDAAIHAPTRHSDRASGWLLAAALALVPAHALLAQVPRTWVSGSGVWSNPLNWSPNDVPNSPPEVAVIAGAGAVTTSLDIPALLVGVTISNANALLAVNPGMVLGVGTPGLSTGLSSSGTLRINSSGAALLTQLRFPASATVSGGGRIELNAHASTLDSAFISADPTFTWTNATGHTVAGTGRLYGPIVNQGLINADRAGLVLQLAGDIQNTGTVSATTGIIELAQGARISGGSLVASPGAFFRVADQAGIASLSLGGDLLVTPGSRLELGAGTVSGAFDIRVNDSGADAVTQVVAVDAATLAGGPASTITLNANALNLDSAILASEASAITIGAGHTIRGSGRIYAPLTGVPTVTANASARELEVLADIDMSAGGALSSTAANSVLSLGDGITVTGGTFAASPGSIGRIKNFASPLLRGTALTGVIEVRRGGLLRIDSLGLSNGGNLLINALAENSPTGLLFVQSATVSGAGFITLNASSADLASAAIRGEPGVTLTNAPGHTIRGNGRVTLPLLNQGAISANNPVGPLQLIANVTNSGAGALSASNATLQLVNAMVLSGGSFTSFGTGRLAVPQGETATLSAFQLNSGAIAHVLGGGSLLFSGGLTNNGQIVVNPAGDAQLSRLRAATTTLSGTGSLILNANPLNLDSAMLDAPGAVLTHASGHTITGQGRIYAPLSNEGVILAGSAGQSLEIVAAVTQTASGRIRAATGKLALRSGTTIDGGQFDRTGLGRLTVDGTVGASNVRSTTPVDVAAGSTFTLTTFINDSEILVNPTSDAPLTRLSIPGTQTLSGTGSVILNALTNPAVRARLDGPASPNLLTTGSGQTLRGSGTIGGMIRIEGAIEPGTAPTGTGQLIFEQAPQLLPATSLNFNFASAVAYDSIAVQQPYTLGGTLRVTLTGGFNPSSVNLFTIVDGSSGATRTAGFDSFSLPTPPPSPNRRTWRLNYLAEDVTLRLTCAADFNGDGLVNDFDFEYFQFAYNNLECPTPESPEWPLQPEPCPADLNQDGVVLDDDFVLFVQAYNALICQ